MARVLKENMGVGAEARGRTRRFGAFMLGESRAACKALGPPARKTYQSRTRA